MGEADRKFLTKEKFSPPSQLSNFKPPPFLFSLAGRMGKGGSFPPA